MTNRYQRGDFVPVAWQPLSVAQAPAGPTIAAGALTTLQIKGHTLDIEALMLDVSNTGLGGFRGRIGGLGDMKGTVNLSLDKDVPPWLAPLLLTPGTPGVAVFGLTPTQGIQVPSILQKKNYTSKIDQEVQWNMDLMGNALAGFLVYPAVLI